MGLGGMGFGWDMIGKDGIGSNGIGRDGMGKDGRDIPPTPLKLNLKGNYPHYHNFCLFLREPIPTLET